MIRRVLLVAAALSVVPSRLPAQPADDFFETQDSPRPRRALLFVPRAGETARRHPPRCARASRPGARRRPDRRARHPERAPSCAPCATRANQDAAQGQAAGQAVIDDLTTWIKLGAVWPASKTAAAADEPAWKKHWAFQPVPPPRDAAGQESRLGSANPDRCLHPAEARSEGLTPSAAADPRHAAAPAVLRSHRPAAERRGGGCVLRDLDGRRN